MPPSKGDLPEFVSAPQSDPSQPQFVYFIMARHGQFNGKRILLRPQGENVLTFIQSDSTLVQYDW